MIVSRKKCCILFFLFSAAIAYSQNTAKKAYSIQRDDGTDIRYYLEPIDGAKAADRLLVILQGSDCNSVTRIKALPKLRRAYPNADLLTVEKYGITDALEYSAETERPDCPKPYLLFDTPAQREQDLEKVIAYLRDTYKYRKIILIGGSEGSVVANMLTAKVKYIDATVLFGGGGRYFVDDVIHCIRFAFSTPEEIDKNIEGFKGFVQYINSQGPYEMAMSDHGYGWWKNMLSIDQQALLAASDSPVLVVQGGKDTSASPEKATEMIESLRSGGKKNIDYYLYPDLDHSLNLSADDGKSEKVISDIRGWIDGKID